MPKNVCPDCHREFSRASLLKRHEATHRGVRMPCSICGKLLAREDALRRHESSHHVAGPTLLAKGARACLGCAAAKVRCEGIKPCVRCRSRSLDCSYPSASTPTTSSSRSAEQSGDSITKIAADQTESPNTSTIEVAVDARHHRILQPPLSPIQQQRQEEHIPYPRDGDHLLGQPDQQRVTDNFDSAAVELVPAVNTTLEQPLYGYMDPVLQPGFWNGDACYPLNWLSTGNFLASSTGDSAVYTVSAEESASLPGTLPLPSEDLENAETSDVYSTQRDTNLPPEIIAAPDLSVSISVWSSTNAQTDPSMDILPDQQIEFEDSPFTQMRMPSNPSSYGMAFHIRAFDLTATVHDGAGPKISPETYTYICQTYKSLCLLSTHYSPFLSPEFLERPVLEVLLALCLERFHPVMPFLDPFVFMNDDAHWLLILAAVSIGAHSVSFATEPQNNLVVSLQEFLRRAIAFVDEQRPPAAGMSRTEIAQVRLLHVLGAGYLGDAQLFRSAVRSLGDLTIFCNSAWTLRMSNVSVDIGWENWRRFEEIIRLMFAIWLVDCMWSYQHHLPTSLTLDNVGDLPMPSSEETWMATDAAAWNSAMQRTQSRHRDTFRHAIHSLYVNKSLVANASDFGRLLLIHGVLHQTWGVERHVKQGLARFEPAAGKQPNVIQDLSTKIWPPSVALFNKWRNSACDCLDTLHHITRGQALSNDTEPATLLHLHQARVLLLSPFYNIVRLASHLAGNDKGMPLPSSAGHALEDKDLIRLWVEKDQYKARQAVVHAGVIFWHVRRFSLNGFYEPTAVSFATLIIWAFCTFCPSRSPSSSSHHNSGRSDENDSSDDDHDVKMILLDRPTDKELVHMFVREGNSMQAYMEGVGDILASGASRRMLKAGKKLLQQLTAWRGSTEGWIALMDSLIQC